MKCDEKGSITSHRACLVAQKYTQIEGINYSINNTYAPTAKILSIQVILATAA